MVFYYVQKRLYICQVRPGLFTSGLQLVEKIGWFGKFCDSRKRFFMFIPPRVILRSNWQSNHKFRALSYLRIYLNFAVMLGNDLIGNSQPQSSTFADRLCSKKWVKYLLGTGGGNSRPVIPNLDGDSIVGCNFRANPNSWRIAFVFLFHLLQRIYCIANNIHKYLIQLRGIALNCRQVACGRLLSGPTESSIYERDLQCNRCAGGGEEGRQRLFANHLD